MRHISERGIALITHYEGFSALPYDCPAGVKTIGYGHVVVAGESFSPNGVNEEQARALLLKDLRKAEEAVCRLIQVSLTDGQFSALTSFTYNMGGAALQRSTLRRKVNREEHTEIPDELLRWVWARDRKWPGLERRRRAEGRLYMS